MNFPIDSDELQEIIALCDPDGIITSWNRAGYEITGFNPDEVIGYHIDTILAEDSRAQLGQILGLRKTGTILPGMPLKLIANFGMEVPVEATSLPRYKEGVFEGWMLIFHDVTIKVQQREELDKLDLLYRSLVENSPAIVYVLDPTGRIVFINETAEALLGYSKVELLGRDMTEFVHPDDRERAFWPLRERRRFPRATQNCEFRFITKAGASRRFDLDFIYVSLNAIGLQGQSPASGEKTLLGTQGIARDITELILLREFSRQVSSILPICSVCRKIRIAGRGGEEWIPLDAYISAKTSTQFSHTYCPDHMPKDI